MLVNAPVVSASYFRTLGIPLLAGELCRNDIEGPAQGMVNRQFAERYFPDESAVGHRLLGGSGAAEVVITGVVENTRDTSRIAEPKPTVYWCNLPGFWPDPIYLIKTQAPPMTLAATIQHRLKQIEPARAVYNVATLDNQISTSMGERRLQTVLLSSFGLTALLLAAVGLYGVVGFYVSQRTREIGLRIALGARPWQMFRHILNQAAVMTVGGLVLGIVAGAALTRLVASLLFGVGRWDPIAFVAAPALLAMVAILATWMPARRATRVDPMEALREE